MGNKRKGDFTPEEWEIISARRRAKSKKWRDANLELARQIEKKSRNSQSDAARRTRLEKVRARTKWRTEHDIRFKEMRRANALAYRARRAADPIRAAQKLASDRKWRAQQPKHQRSAQAPTILPIFSNALFVSVWSIISPCEAREDIASEALIHLLDGSARSPADAVALGKRTHYRAFSQFRRAVSLDEITPCGLSRHEQIGSEVFHV